MRLWTDNTKCNRHRLSRPHVLFVCAVCGVATAAPMGCHCTILAGVSQSAQACTEIDLGKPAARIGDKILQDGPHCHAPIHPPAPSPTPVPHPPLPLTIVKGQPNVLIGGMPAARVSDISTPCILPGCVPAGPGMVAMGSATVLIGGLPAARMGDMTAHSSCVAPIPMPTGKILPPCCPTVLIGG